MAKGIDLHINNFTKTEFLLILSFHDEKGVNISKLAIPIRSESPEKDVTFYYDYSFDASFDGFSLQSKLLRLPDASLLDQRIGLYPGKMSTMDWGPAGAGSDRIAVQIGIRKMNGKVKITFADII